MNQKNSYLKEIKELAASLDEFLSFRHLFRNIYGFELIGDRVDRLVEKFFITAD